MKFHQWFMRYFTNITCMSTKPRELGPWPILFRWTRPGEPRHPAGAPSLLLQIHFQLILKQTKCFYIRHESQSVDWWVPLLLLCKLALAVMSLRQVNMMWQCGGAKVITLSELILPTWSWADRAMPCCPTPTAHVQPAGGVQHHSSLRNLFASFKKLTYI